MSKARTLSKSHFVYLETTQEIDGLENFIDLQSNGETSRGLGIVESGSNANGSYVRFENGTMECWGRGPSNINISSNTVVFTTVTFYHSHIQSITMPASFLNNSLVINFTAGIGSYPSTYYTTNYTVNSFQYYVWSLLSSDSMTTGIHWRATGVWK